MSLSQIISPWSGRAQVAEINLFVLVHPVAAGTTILFFCRPHTVLKLRRPAPLSMMITRLSEGESRPSLGHKKKHLFVLPPLLPPPS